MKPDASKCVPFEQKKEEEEEDVDYYQFGAILCALVGMFFRMKLLSWTSVFLSMASIATTKTTKLTMMNIASSLMVTGAGLFMNYFATRRPQPQ
eukprot:CAMPEP_0195521714 /NCGR_PEP_ID=MMETSP0794_2-20130614/19223_1 /TAXON_ID=515487 /ORGANISM="Stephanopyxis turris, Strain CCMP 815" /LENGTH=93 /DNA_ID=CAMNT_0040651327 /DNA_START=62 /DNA_END=343 /DNA_ORIENTATION=+